MENSRNLIKVNASAPQKQPKRLEILSKISDTMRQRVYESALENSTAYGTFEYNAGWVEVTMHRNGNVEVIVCHSDNEHQSPTLEKAIADWLPDWGEVEEEAEKDEREELEFRDYLWRNCRYW